MKLGSLFSGIGGLDLGLVKAGFELAWVCEQDAFCRNILRRHWSVPIFEDVRTLVRPPPVGAISGGFPCQDLSSANVAGRKGLQGEKSGLWTAMLRVVREASPRLVIVENAGHPKGWVPDVRGGLAEIGYWTTPPLLLSSRAFGAAHRRPRWFVVADANGEGEPLRSLYEAVAGLSPSARARPGPEECVRGFRGDDGFSVGVDSEARRRALGNAVDPHVAEWLGRAILSAIGGRS